MKEVIQEIIKDFHKRGIPKFRERDVKIPLNSTKIVSIIGPRRAGKTYLLYQAMSKIKDITNVIYINFEDERLELTVKELNQIIEAYFEIYPNKKEEDLFFFFDEIQEIKGWEKFVRRVYDTITKNIFITGSSSKLLSKEIATSLRGRTVTYEVFPLSFKEYLKFKGVEVDIHSTKGKAQLISTFSKYMTKGSFPETVNMNKELYEKSLRNYFEVMLYRDIVERYEVTNVSPLKTLIKKLVANTAKEFSVNKIFNGFKSQNIKVSKDSLYKYLEYCEDAYVLFIISNYSESMAKQVLKKAYSIDTGLSSLITITLSKEQGRLFENIVLLELKRREHEIYFYKDKFECDFIIKEKDKITEAIQVCYDLDENNKEREFNGLKEAMERFKLKKGLILTYNQEEKVGDIEIKPAWKWLLEKN